MDGVIGDPPSHHLDVVVRNARCAVPAVRVRLLLSERWCRPATRSRSESEVRQYVECKDAGADVRPCSVRVFVLSILINSNVDDQSKGELVVHFFSCRAIVRTPGGSSHPSPSPHFLHLGRTNPMHTTEVSDHFYAVLERSGDLGLRNVLFLIDLLLEQPLHPCEHCDAAFAHYARLDAQRVARIEAYTPQRVHPVLFAGSILRAWLDAPLDAALALDAGAARDTALRALLRTDAPGVCSCFIFRFIVCESCSQFDFLLALLIYFNFKNRCVLPAAPLADNVRAPRRGSRELLSAHAAYRA